MTTGTITTTGTTMTTIIAPCDRGGRLGLAGRCSAQWWRAKGVHYAGIVRRYCVRRLCTHVSSHVRVGWHLMTAEMWRVGHWVWLGV